MDCKNCERPLRTDYSFCANCGAKVIRNRLTIKNLFYDFSERYFNLDNTFLKTFKALFSKPEDVIVGYINGVRKKYLNPISYFTIAVFLGGLFFFLNKKFFPEVMDYQLTLMEASQTDEAQKITKVFLTKYQAFIQEYQNLIYISLLPIITLISRLIFINKKQFNLSEHFVINVYAYTHTSIVVNALYIFSIWNGALFYWVSTLTSVFLIGYFSYMYKRTFDLSWGQIALKLLLFLIVVGGFLLISLFAFGYYLGRYTDTFDYLK